MRTEDDKQLEKALENCPKELPFFLNALTTAGHLMAAGYEVVQEQVDPELLPGTALIFAPVLLEDGHIDMVFEVRANVLFTIQQAAEECGVTYRTIQRWRDEKKILCFEVGGKQLFPSAILKEQVARLRR